MKSKFLLYKACIRGPENKTEVSVAMLKVLAPDLFFCYPFLGLDLSIVQVIVEFSEIIALCIPRGLFAKKKKNSGLE